jgi:hypothetical protein
MLAYPELVHKIRPAEITFQQQCFLIPPASQRASQIRRNRALAFLRDGTGNQNLFQRAALPKLTQADRKKTEFLCA